jgi:hypothetical protein
MKSVSLSLLSLGLLALVSASCGGGGGGANRCNPLGGPTCLSPFPSAAFLVADETSVTGFRLDLDQSVMPVNVADEAADAAYWNRWDGFSPNAFIVVAFPGGVSSEGLPTWRNPEASLEAGCPTVLLDMDTGERVLHFAELDANSPTPTDQALLIRPLVRLKSAHRYAVAIRTSVKAAGGGALPANAAFETLKTGGKLDHPLFSRIEGRYPEIFAKLETAGVTRADLALAWDFVTASDEFLTGDMMTMRDLALPAMGDGSDIEFTLEEHTSDNPDVLRLITGTFEAPNFLDGPAYANPSVLARDAQDKPVLAGSMTAKLAAIIPACATTATEPLPVLLFGHGLFGNGADYIDDDLVQRVANENCVIILATDWLGLTDKNIPTVALALNRISLAPTVTDKLLQGVINFMTLTRLAKGGLGAHALFQVDGASVVDPTRIWYFGASLGGIMGGTFMAYEPEVESAALGVPGCNWTMCFERSYAWPPLRLALQNAYPGYVHNEENLLLVGMVFDRTDPATTARHVIHDPLPGVPAKKIWFYYSLDDSLVANLASESMIRSLGIPVTGPSAYVPFGVEETTAPVTSGATIYDEHATPAPPDENVAPLDDNGTHGGVHERNAVLSTLKHFFYQGELVHGCALEGVPAPCDCTTGACDNTVD